MTRSPSAGWRTVYYWMGVDPDAGVEATDEQEQYC